jgi:hypothetical protein
VDALVALGAALAGAGLLALAAVGATVTVAVAVSGRLVGRWADLALLLTPHVVRAAVGLVVGVTVATAAPVATTATASIEQPCRTLQLPPGWSPDRPAADPHDGEHTGQPTRDVHSVTEPPACGSGARSGPAGSGPAGSAPAGSGTAGSGAARRLAIVVVHRGDTLWDIAERHLGPGAHNAQVAAEWPRWHAANRSTVGPDPNLILPGQRLRPPDQRPPADNASTDREESP